MSKIEEEPSGKTNLSFQVGPVILNLLLFYSDLIFFQCAVNPYINQSNIFVIWGFKIKFVSKLINKFARLLCLTIFSVHKDCFHF